ncbi:MAG: spoIIIJ-associated protein [Verrucomicrobiales bacterium]|jgi:spoIIIJ-associated protein
MMSYGVAAKDLLDTMLGYLGFVVSIDVDESGPEPSLQVQTNEGDYLIGQNGDRLDDIQYLVNRILQSKDEKAPRIRVDINYFRSMSEDQLIEEAESLAQRVINTGRPAKLKPLNSYHRRIVHNHFLEHQQLKTWSPKGSDRLKQITISLSKSDKAQSD